MMTTRSTLARATNRLAPTRRVTGPAVLALTLPLAVGGGQACGPTSPERAEDVRITLAVSGGFVGVDWQITIDGASRSIIGDRCRGRNGGGCDWATGDRLATFEADAILDLAAEFRERGFFRLSQDDYGDQCCDQFFYVLTYVDDDDRRTVRGADGTLPEVARDLIAAVNAFVAAAREG